MSAMIGYLAVRRGWGRLRWCGLSTGRVAVEMPVQCRGILLGIDCPQAFADVASGPTGWAP